MVEITPEVRNLSKTFRYRTGWNSRQTVDAVKPLSFTRFVTSDSGHYRRKRFRLQIHAGKDALAGMIEPPAAGLAADDHPALRRLFVSKPTYSG